MLAAAGIALEQLRLCHTRARAAQLVLDIGAAPAPGELRAHPIISRLVARKRERGPLDELTEREREVLALLAEGRSNTAVGDSLFLSRKTIEAYISQIFLKLGLTDSPEHHRRVLAVLAFLRAR